MAGVRYHSPSRELEILSMQVDVIRTDVTIRNQVVPATLALPKDKSQIRAGIVYVHGSGEGHESEVAIEARRFASKGVAFLTVAKVMVGYSRTKRDYLALARDAAEALEWLRGAPRPIGFAYRAHGIQRRWLGCSNYCGCPTRYR